MRLSITKIKGRFITEKVFPLCMCLCSLLPPSLLIKWLLQISILGPLVSHLFCQVLQCWGDESHRTEGCIFYLLLKYLLIRHPFIQICHPHSGDQPSSLALAVRQGLILVKCWVLGADTLGALDLLFHFHLQQPECTPLLHDLHYWHLVHPLTVTGFAVDVMTRLAGLFLNQEWVGKSPTHFVTNSTIWSPAGRETHYSHTLGCFSKPRSQQALSAAYICHVWKVRARSALGYAAHAEKPGLRSWIRQNHNQSSSALWTRST